VLKCHHHLHLLNRIPGQTDGDYEHEEGGQLEGHHSAPPQLGAADGTEASLLVAEAELSGPAVITPKKKKLFLCLQQFF
jgi:hypothetical protein